MALALFACIGGQALGAPAETDGMNPGPGEGASEAAAEPTEGAAEPDEESQARPVTLRQVAPGAFVSLVDDMGEYPRWSFVLGADGRATHITGGRTYPRSR